MQWSCRSRAVRSIVQWIAIRRSKNLDPKKGGTGNSHQAWLWQPFLEALFNVHPLQLVIDQFTSFWRSLNLFTFLIFLSRMILENWNLPGTNEECMSQATKSLFNFPATSKRYAQQKPCCQQWSARSRQTLTKEFPLALKAKVGKFPSRPLTNARKRREWHVSLESDPNFCPVDVELRKRLHFESVGSAHLLPSRRLPCTHCARTWGNKVAINVPKSWSKKGRFKNRRNLSSAWAKGMWIKCMFFLKAMLVWGERLQTRQTDKGGIQKNCPYRALEVVAVGLDV